MEEFLNLLSRYSYEAFGAAVFIIIILSMLYSFLWDILKLKHRDFNSTTVEVDDEDDDDENDADFCDLPGECGVCSRCGKRINV